MLLHPLGEGRVFDAGELGELRGRKTAVFELGQNRRPAVGVGFEQCRGRGRGNGKRGGWIGRGQRCHSPQSYDLYAALNKGGYG